LATVKNLLDFSRWAHVQLLRFPPKIFAARGFKGKIKRKTELWKNKPEAWVSFKPNLSSSTPRQVSEFSSF
jgi:hypothetical protein